MPQPKKPTKITAVPDEPVVGEDGVIEGNAVEVDQPKDQPQGEGTSIYDNEVQQLNAAEKLVTDLRAQLVTAERMVGVRMGRVQMLDDIQAIQNQQTAAMTQESMDLAREGEDVAD